MASQDHPHAHHRPTSSSIVPLSRAAPAGRRVVAWGRRRSSAARASDALPVWLRRFRLEVLLWAFREGRPVDPVALTAVLGAKHHRADEPFHQWSRHGVRELLWVDIDAWWRDVVADGSPPPATAAATMWTLLDHLDAVDGFAPGTDPLALLREPLVDLGGLDRSGRPNARRRRLRHPSMHGGR